MHKKDMFNLRNGAGYIGGLHLAGVGNAWVGGAGESYHYELLPVPNNDVTLNYPSDLPDLPLPNEPTTPHEPSPPQQPNGNQTTQTPSQQPSQQQPQQTQQQSQQTSVIDLFNRLRSMFSTNYTPSSPVVLLQPPQPLVQSYNYSLVLIIGIIAASIILLYYIYKK